MAAAPIAIAPEVAAGAMSLFTLILWGIALGLSLAWRNTIGALFEHLADVMDRVQVHAGPVRVRPLATFSGGLRDLDWLIQNVLDKTVAGCEHATVWLFHTMINMFEWTAHEIAAVAEDSARVFWRVTTKTIPHAVKSAAHVQDQHLARERHQRSAAVSRTNSHVSALRDDVHALGHATTIALPRDIGRVRGRTGRLEHDLEGIKSKVERLAGLATLAGFSAFMWRYLTRHGLRWLRCPALGRIGSKIGCGGFGLLEDLLAASFVALALSDICAFAGALTKLAEWYRPLLMDFVDVEDQMLKCKGGYSKPDPLGLPRLYLPPVPDPLPLG